MFKSLGHWLRQIFSSSQPDQPGTASLPQSESNSQMAEQFDSIDAASHLVPYDENLLERARTQWQFGDWHSLAKLDRDTLQHHPDRAKLALLAAAGRLQIGQDSEARQYIRLAQDWGCSDKHISQILIAGVHNNIAHAAALGNQNHRALQHFQKAITFGTPGADAKLLSQARTSQQLTQLGLTPAKGYIKVGVGCTASSAIYQPSFPKTPKETINDKLFNFSSSKYWEERYQKGGTSGNGSYGRLAEFKAKFINKFIEDKGIECVVEFGCGDGNQLSMLRVKSYIGVDISPTIIDKCKNKFKDDITKLFLTKEEYLANPLKGDLTLSLDVIFHLIEDNIFEEYMRMLLSASSRYCMVYASNNVSMGDPAIHVKHRKFTDWIENYSYEWRLEQIFYNKYACRDGVNAKDYSFSDFYCYERN